MATTIDVTMRQTRLGEDGTYWQAGSTYAASLAFARLLVSANLAVAKFPPLVSSPLELALESTSAAATNLATINAALQQGDVTLKGQGLAYVNGSLVVPSNTRLLIPGGLRLKMQNPGTNVPMIVNENWQSPSVTVSNGITDAATSPALAGRRLATADFGSNAHGRKVGDYVLMKGDTTRRYLGIYRVHSVINAFKLTFLVTGSSGIGASSGTVTCQQADANITIAGGGVLDYNGFENQTDYGYNCMLAVINKVRNLQVSNLQLLDSPKYCIYWGNLVNATFSDLHIEGPSAAIQGIGLGIGVSVHRIKGRTNDDFIAWTGDNAGYPEFNFTNGGLDGALMGFDVRDVTCQATNANVVGIYPTAGSENIGGITIDGLRTLTPPGRYVYIDGDVTITTAGAGDIRISNLIGRPPQDSGVKLAGYIGGMTVRKLTIEHIDWGTGNLTVPILATGNNLTVGRIRVRPEARMAWDSTAGQRYVVQLASGSTFGDVALEDCAITNGTGGSGTYGFGGNWSGANAAVRRCEFFGTAAAISGAPTGGTVLTIENCFFDTFRGADVTGAFTLYFRNNRFRAPSGPCLLAYGSGFTANVHAHGNHWGNAGTWLQIGVSAGDTLRCDVWQSGNRADAGVGSAINFTASSGTNYLRQSDANLPVDATKWTAIETGCVFQNNNASFGAGVGIYVRGTSTSARLVA